MPLPALILAQRAFIDAASCARRAALMGLRAVAVPVLAVAVLVAGTLAAGLLVCLAEDPFGLDSLLPALILAQRALAASEIL